MIIIVGESGSGKSSVAKELANNFGYKNIVTYTTRPPRKGEVDGVDYNFISNDTFIYMMERGMFAETAEYRQWFYGSAIEDYADDKSVIVLTPSGMRQIRKNKEIKAVVFYLNVPRRDRLIKILQRGDNIEEAYRRSLSDVGQFDGVQKEADTTIENAGYKLTPYELALYINQMNNMITNATLNA